jgi:hypothetical protein
MNRNTVRIGTGFWAAAVVLLALTMAVAPASAQSITDDVQIHGFGGWAYGETDGHAYLVGTEQGRYDNANFALNVTAQPIEKLSIVAQIRGEAVGGEDSFELDYAFAAWALSDALNARIGRVKHPFGVYGEIVDVGTLRPFYTLPQSIYGSGGFTARAYNGVGLTGRHIWDSAWGLEWDLYLGQIEGDFTTTGLSTTIPELFLEPTVDIGFEVNQTVGGRINLLTPVDGFKVGVSAYTGDDETMLPLMTPDTKREVQLGSVEYLDRHLSIRAEYGRLERLPDFETNGGYVEVAGKITRHWQLAARWDTYEVEVSADPANLPPFYPQLLKHDELAFGINYWFSPGLVVRLSYQQVEGNKFAFLETPAQVLELLMTGALENETDLIVFGAQFSF